jgi:hypothetical protein
MFLPALVLLSSIVGGGVEWYARVGRFFGEPNRRSSEAEIDELRAKIDGLENALTKAKVTAATAAIFSASAGRPVDICRPPENATGSTTSPKQRVRAAPEISEGQLLQKTEEYFRGEARDPLWSRNAEATAGKELLFETRGSGEVQNLECHSTICRAEVVYVDRAAYDESLGGPTVQSTIWMSGGTWSLPRERPDGRIEVDRYLFREGEDPQRDIYAAEEAAQMAASGTERASPSD